MLVQTVAPAVEPISLAEARLQCKLTADDSASEDGLIAIWIAAARRYAEAWTGRSFVTQEWRLVLDGFPGYIQLERGTVQEIDSITYRDMAGVTQTITWDAPSGSLQRSADDTLVADLSDGRIAPAFGSVWPIALPEIGAVAVNYTAGYGDASEVPEGIKAWILLRVARLHEQREEIVDGNIRPCPLDGLLDPFVIAMP